MEAIRSKPKVRKKTQGMESKDNSCCCLCLELRVRLRIIVQYARNCTSDQLLVHAHNELFKLGMPCWTILGLFGQGPTVEYHFRLTQVLALG